MADVLHVISGLGVGGAETMLAQIASGLAKRGMPQFVVSITGDGPIAARLEDSGIPVARLDLRSGAKGLRDLSSLVALASKHRPRILQGWMYHGDLAATLCHCAVGGRYDRRLIWGIRCSNMDFERHANVIRWEARLSRLPTAIVANSEAGAKAHLAYGYRPRQLKVIPNGIDTHRFRPDDRARARIRDEIGIPNDAVVAINTARVDPMKDHDTLLRAVAQVPGLWLLLVGAGTKEYLDCQSEVSGLVRALGRRDDIPALLSAADIIVSSSAFGEGFSNALAEGMASGLIPVCTNVGDSERIVGDTGFTIAPQAQDELASILAQCVRMPIDLRQGFGSAARNRIKAKFGLEKALDQFEDLYRSHFE